MSEFVNKVAESGILTLNLEDYFPKQEIAVFDLKDFLFMGLILKEKDFREALKQLDVTPYQDKVVALTCSTDAIIPVWAYMLVTSLLEPIATEIIFGNEEFAQQSLLIRNIAALNKEEFNDQRVVVKGCGELPVKEAAYIEVTKLLRPYAKSIMYGEPCSTVPVFKKPLIKK
ncbi:MAG TPA: DUF2480 family protein [Ferruginibacter sp.]|nr:DUF2480 family protein [Ferruginibacter sp.]